jgi:CO/xanthine dehydrogenase Mo-binding subunit
VARAARIWVNAIAPKGTPEVMAVLLGRTAGSAFGSGFAPDETSTEGASNMLYGFPALRVEHAIVDVPVPVGFWRSVGFSANAFVVESFVDELAHAAGADPYAFRRKLLANEPRGLAVLDLAASRAGWKPNSRQAGIAYCHSFNTHVAQVAEIGRFPNGEIRVTRVVCAVDCGSVVNPDLVAAQMESGIVFGLSAAFKQKITFEKGGVKEGNFNDFALLRMFEMPKVEVHIVPSTEAPTGVGEPGVPPIAPAVGNAIFAMTGKRLRKLPFGAVT